MLISLAGERCPFAHVSPMLHMCCVISLAVRIDGPRDAAAASFFASASL
jgi:hypothetical protein